MDFKETEMDEESKTESSDLSIKISIEENTPPHPSAWIIGGKMCVGKAECKKRLNSLAKAQIDVALAMLFPPKAK